MVRAIPTGWPGLIKMLFHLHCVSPLISDHVWHNGKHPQSGSDFLHTHPENINIH